MPLKLIIAFLAGLLVGDLATQNHCGSLGTVELLTGQVITCKIKD